MVEPVIVYSFAMCKSALLHCVVANSVRSRIGRNFTYFNPIKCWKKPRHLSGNADEALHFSTLYVMSTTRHLRVKDARPL